MLAHTSLKASFSFGVVYSLAVKAMVIPVLNDSKMLDIGLYVSIVLVDLRL